MATLYRTDGTRETVQPANGRDFKLDELYKLLAVEMVEVVRLDAQRIMVIDEEGKLNGSEVNVEATRLAARAIGPFDCIVGNALLCLSRQVR